MMGTRVLIRIAAIGLLFVIAACATSHGKDCKGHAVPINDPHTESAHGAGPGR